MYCATSSGTSAASPWKATRSAPLATTSRTLSPVSAISNRVESAERTSRVMASTRASRFMTRLLHPGLEYC